MNTVCAFINIDQTPISTHHICYFTKDEGQEISLMQVVEETYPHPDASEHAVLTITRVRTVKTRKRIEFNAAHFLLMEAQQKTCRAIEKSQF